MNVLLADESGTDGDQQRNDVLRLLLQRLCAIIGDWSPVSPPALAQDYLILAHSTTRTNSEIDTVLPEWAKQGATVVLYSGGGVAVRRDDRCGAGRIIEMHWDVLKQVLQQLEPGFNHRSFHSALDAVNARHVINALAIVAWCASFQSDSQAIVKRQSEWRMNREKWLFVFGKCTPKDFATACGVTKPSEIPEQLSAVRGVVDWLWPASGSTPPVPNFKLAVDQIKTRFSVRK